MTDHALLSAWENFYVIVGSSGAALVGIQFVVIALISDMRQRPTADTIGAFGTPTVVHFGGALLISAILSAPWPSLAPASVALAACGLGGLLYVAVAIRRARRQTMYQPVLEDWIWYMILPSSVYAALALAGLLLRTAPQTVLFVVAAASLGLLVIGIHNSWDTVTHLVITTSKDDAQNPADER